MPTAGLCTDAREYAVSASNGKVAAAILAEACSWLGTPFQHEAALKGPRGGVDCVMFFVRCYQAGGVIPGDFDPRPYASGGFVTAADRRFARAVAAWATLQPRGTVPSPADFVIFRLDHAFKHGAIVASWPTIIHPMPDGAVVEHSIASAGYDGLDFSLWAPREGLAHGR